MLLHKLLLGLLTILIWNTTIHRAHSSTLWFLMETYTLSTFVGDYIVIVITDRLLYLIGIGMLSTGQNDIPTELGAITIAPIIGAFINSIVRTFRFASPTIDTVVCYYNCHFFIF